MKGARGNWLPDFEAVAAQADRRHRGKASNECEFLCWNYVFELSPLGKHLFRLERLAALYEAFLPTMTPWLLKAAKKCGNLKLAVRC
uniref:Wsv269-like protein n=1 Tax=Sicyonia whispovirus TaxID=2984283 RepID=A0A9C7CG04_9VIRU|nr:MAG: wsv269-like protein [Sicyonia whispovirus]